MPIPEVVSYHYISFTVDSRLGMVNLAFALSISEHNVLLSSTVDRLPFGSLCASRKVDINYGKTECFFKYFGASCRVDHDLGRCAPENAQHSTLIMSDGINMTLMIPDIEDLI